MNEQKIRISVVDDHAVVREGLCALLASEEGLVVVGSHGSGRAALAALATEAPDVVLLDVRMPDLDGLEVLRRILRERPETRVLMLSSQGGDESIFQALRAGAAGYLLKKSAFEEMAAAIRAARAGQVTPSGEVAARLARRVGRVELSARELDVLRAIARGQSNKQVAASLGITESTVKNHVNSLLAKLSADDRTHAVTIGLQSGIIDLAE